MLTTHTVSTVHNSPNDSLQYAPPKTCQHFHAYLIMALGGSTIEGCFKAQKFWRHRKMNKARFSLPTAVCIIAVMYSILTLANNSVIVSVPQYHEAPHSQALLYMADSYYNTVTKLSNFP